LETVLTTSIDRAAAIIRGGGVVAFPTETVYGLGANVFHEAAVAGIFEAKERPADNPLIAHVSSIDQIGELASNLSFAARKLIHAFFPGPLTLVLAKTARVPLIASAGLNTMGVRMPSLDLARAFLNACGVPVVAPSANLSGRPSPTTWQAVYEDLNGRIDCILQGDATDIGLESTVVDCTSEAPVLLRKGAVSLADLQGVVSSITTLPASNEASLRSPGLRHRHYSPRARVIIGTPLAWGRQGPAPAGYIGMTPPPKPYAHTLVCDSLAEYAHSLFEFFRRCDRESIEIIYCESVVEEGIGAALMDRLRRAAAG
jgi:L-threonylcarbamoyladenylate synthase